MPTPRVRTVVIRSPRGQCCRIRELAIAMFALATVTLVASCATSNPGDTPAKSSFFEIATTEQTTTSTTGATTTTTPQDTDGSNIELRSSGLGPVQFGSIGRRAIDYVTALVGDTDSDTTRGLVALTNPWHDSGYGDFYAYGDDPDDAVRSFVTPYVREVCWSDQLCLTLGSETGREWTFMGWDYCVFEEDTDSGYTELGARTVEGIGPGTTLGEVAERYPRIDIWQLETEVYAFALPGWERPSATFNTFTELTEECYGPDGIPVSCFDPSIRISCMSAGIPIEMYIGSI